MHPGKSLQRLEGGLWVKPRASFHEGSGESCSHHTLSSQGLRAWKDNRQLNEAGLRQGEAWSLCSRSHWTSCPGAGRGGRSPRTGVCITSAARTSQRPSNSPSCARRPTGQPCARLTSGVREGEGSGGNGLCLKLLWLALLKKLTVNLR